MKGREKKTLRLTSHSFVGGCQVALTRGPTVLRDASLNLNIALLRYTSWITPRVQKDGKYMLVAVAIAEPVFQTTIA